MRSYKSVDSFLKKLIKSILPKSFIFKNELYIRYFYGMFYIGKTHRCNICEHKLRSFIDDNKQICPFCGSLPRNRRLWQLLNDEDELKGNVLHFSPSRSLYRSLKKNKKIRYYSSDFEDEFLAEYKFDITEIDQSEDKFQLIICYHILEHIEEDQKAISELYRVLSPKGKIYVQTPFKKGDIYEDNSIISPEEREVNFGQWDHVRIYSIDGLKYRLEKAGFVVEVKTFRLSDKDAYFGFITPEIIMTLSK